MDLKSIPEGPLDLALRVTCSHSQTYIASIVSGVIDRIPPQVNFPSANTISSNRGMFATFTESIKCNTVVTSVTTTSLGLLLYGQDYTTVCNGNDLEFNLSPELVGFVQTLITRISCAFCFFC